MRKQKLPKGRKQKVHANIYDDVIRTIQERHGKLLIPMVNETFQEHYPEGTSVTRLPDDYRKVVSKVVADSCNIIGDKVYHVECQSIDDSTMILRMVEYDFMLGLSGAEIENGLYKMRFPRSCVIYLRHGDNAPEAEEMELIFQDGQAVRYKVPAVRVQSYTIDDIFKKKLYLFLPFYILRYENRLKSLDSDEASRREIVAEYESIMERMETALIEQPDVYQDLLQLMREVSDYLLRMHDGLKEEVGFVMGGKVLPLPSDALLKEREEGREEGWNERTVELVRLNKAKGRTAAEIAEFLGETLDKVENIYNSINEMKD